MENIYRDMALRTGGHVYIGVVGPVRTGKSTMIKKVMELLVLPNMEDPYRRERARDELPQSGSGRTIMTAEPKFVPEEAVEIYPDGKTKLAVRFIDSVGYLVPGAVGADEEGEPHRTFVPLWKGFPEYLRRSELSVDDLYVAQVFPFDGHRLSVTVSEDDE